MAVLTNARRLELWAEWQRDNNESCAITKADLKAAVDAMDDWWKTQAVAANLAIPQPARGALTPRQKVRLFMLVLRKRYEVA